MRARSSDEDRSHPDHQPRAKTEAVPGSVARILALQRSAGNAAVSRMLSGSDPMPAQRLAVNDVLRSPGSPLGGQVRTDMEQRLGADFSDVRLHTGPVAQRSADELGARAYTVGRDIVLGRGGGDRHTLAHELTHVVQQRQGPVAGTGIGQGLSVSDPGDHFEREADATATRALSGSAPTQATPAADSAAATAPAAQIQRKIGFEIEVDNEITDAAGGQMVGDTALATSSASFSVVTDKRIGYSNMEFVTDARQVINRQAPSTTSELEAQLDAIKVVADHIDNQDVSSLNGAPSLALTSAGTTAKLTHKHDNPGVLFAQYTVGVPLGGTEGFFGQVAADQVPAHQARGVDREPTFRMKQSANFGGTVLDKFERWFEGRQQPGKRKLDEPPETERLKGFAQLLYTQIAGLADFLHDDFRLAAGQTTDSPGQVKNRVLTLSRSNMHDARALLPAVVQEFLAAESGDLIDSIIEFQDAKFDGTEARSFLEDQARGVGDEEPFILIDYAVSALTGTAPQRRAVADDPNKLEETGSATQIGQQQTFGGMNEIAPHDEAGAMMVPLEVRRLGRQFKTWAQVRADLRKLAAWEITAHEKDREITESEQSKRRG